MTNSASTSTAARFSQPPSPTPVAGLEPVPLLAQLYAVVASRYTPRGLRRTHNLISGAILSLFSFYLLLHIHLAWPRVLEALQNGGAL
jgi:hypothetical protein